MRISVFSTCFAPSVGGIERLIEILAREWTAMGHEVVVMTSTHGPDGGFPYQVVRDAGWGAFARWVRWSDVHLEAGISLNYTPRALLWRRPVVISHQTYYLPPDGHPSWRGRAKLVLAGHLPGIACSAFLASGIAGANAIGNPYDSSVFASRRPWAERDRDIAFVGRLVSDKGCDTLIEALGILGRQGLVPSVTIVGDGDERARLQQLVADLGLQSSVAFVGARAPSEVAELLNRHRLMVVPSRWPEPFGIVALEGLACGCLPVVSRDGGLPEAIGPHGLAFPNGSAVELARMLRPLLEQPRMAHERLAGVETHLERFTSRNVAMAYLEKMSALISSLNEPPPLRVAARGKC